MRKVAVTGKPGVGKSTICRLFEELGARTANTDAIVHHLLSQDKVIAQQVVALLGDKILVEGKIDRHKVADLVFQNPEKLRQLEEIVHPAVRKTLQTIFQEAAQTNIPLIIVEVPLLFEACFENEFDVVVAVTAATCKSQATHLNARVSRLLPDEVIVDRSHYHISNEGDLASLQQTIFNLFNQLKS